MNSDSKLKDIALTLIALETATAFLGIAAYVLVKYATPEIALAFSTALITASGMVLTFYFTRDKGNSSE